MFSYAKCAVGQHGQTPQNLSIPKLLNKNSNNNDDRLLKELAESEDITPKDFYRKISPKNLKIDIPDGLNTLKINRGSKENKFAAGYTNYFADVLLKLNNCCSFKFVYNFVKKKDSRKKISPLFTVKAKCAMEGCPVKVTIQRYENSKGPDEFLKVRFSGDIKHRRGDLKARKLSHKKKSELEDYFKQSKSKPSIAYRDKLASMDPLQFASGNRDGLGVGLKSFQNIASKVHKERDELNNMNNNICALQKRFVDEDKERDVLKKKKVYGYIHYPSLSDSGISLTMTDEGLVRYYHKVAPLDVLFFDASGSFVSGVPWLKNKKNKKKRILLYALMARLPSGKCPPLPLLEYISSENNVFSIRQAFSRLREVENRIYGSGNAVSPKLIIIDYSAAMVQAVLQEFTGSTLEEYLERTYRIIHGKADKSDLEKTFIRICAYHFLQMCRRNLKPYSESQQHFALRAIGRLICFEDLEEMTEFVNDLAKVICSRLVSDDVDAALTRMEIKINNFQYSQQDRIALENTKRNSDNLVFDCIETGHSGSWHEHWNRTIKANVTSKKSTSTSTAQNNKYYTPKFFFYLRGLLDQVPLWSNLLCGDLDRFSNQYKKSLTAGRTLSNDEITNAYAELFFHLKKADSSKKNLPLVEFVEANKKFSLALKRQFIDKMAKDMYPKATAVSLKKSLLGNCDEQDEFQQMLEERWMPKRTRTEKRRDRKSFLASPATPIRFSKRGVIKKTEKCRCQICHKAYERELPEFEIRPEDRPTSPLYYCNDCITDVFQDILNYAMVQSFTKPVTDDDLFTQVLLSFNELSENEKTNYHSSVILTLQYCKASNHPEFRQAPPITNKGITNLYANCFASSSLQLLLGTCVNKALPIDDEICNNKLTRYLRYIRDELSNESNSPFPFGNGLDGESAIGEIINVVCKHDYRTARYVDAEEFMMVLLNKLFHDEQSPFHNIFVEFTRCLSCNHILHSLTTLQALRVKVDHNKHQETLTCLLQKTFFHQPLEGRSRDLYPNECCDNANPLIGRYLGNTPPFLLIMTNRSDNAQMVVRKQVKVEEHIDISKIAGFKERIQYNLVGSINFIGKDLKHGHYITYLVEKRNMLKIDDNSFQVLEKSIVLKDPTFQSTTHVLCYVKNTKATEEEFLLDESDWSSMNQILLSTLNPLSSSISNADIKRCLVDKANDEIINGFLSFMKNRLPDEITVISSLWYQDVYGNRLSDLRRRFGHKLALYKDVVLIPVHEHDHWLLIFIKDDIAVVYDPLIQPRVNWEGIKVVNNETLRYKSQPLEWLQLKGRKQQNLVDCGYLVLAMAWDLCKRKESATKIPSPLLRRWIASQCAKVEDAREDIPKYKEPRNWHDHQHGNIPVAEISFGSLMKLLDKKDSTKKNSPQTRQSKQFPSQPTSDDAQMKNSTDSPQTRQSKQFPSQPTSNDAQMKNSTDSQFAHTQKRKLSSQMKNFEELIQNIKRRKSNASDIEEIETTLRRKNQADDSISRKTKFETDIISIDENNIQVDSEEVKEKKCTIFEKISSEDGISSDKSTDTDDSVSDTDIKGSRRKRTFQNDDIFNGNSINYFLDSDSEITFSDSENFNYHRDFNEDIDVLKPFKDMKDESKLSLLIFWAVNCRILTATIMYGQSRLDENEIVQELPDTFRCRDLKRYLPRLEQYFSDEAWASFIGNIENLKARRYKCAKCNGIMPRNEATLQCDRCFRWVHWTVACSGVARNPDVKNLTFFCHGCKSEVKSAKDERRHKIAFEIGKHSNATHTDIARDILKRRKSEIEVFINDSSCPINNLFLKAIVKGNQSKTLKNLKASESNELVQEYFNLKNKGLKETVRQILFKLYPTQLTIDGDGPSRMDFVISKLFLNVDEY
uniref:ubiquitinyl hydrolase 1 n=1 Tax=Clytia hemisphaerica TaxID=252671 RepID=A0A7M5UQC9_9CNID